MVSALFKGLNRVGVSLTSPEEGTMSIFRNSSWLQIRRLGFDSRHYQKRKVVGLERGSLSLVSTTEELLHSKNSGSCLENREYGRRDPSRSPRGTRYLQTLAFTSPTSGGRSVGIVRSRTQTMEFVCLFVSVFLMEKVL
jgi:hypothetical protein